MRSLLLVLFLMVEAPGGEWSSQEIEPKARAQDTAYTIGKRNVQIGAVHQRYGLLTNTHIGTTAPLYFLGIVNGTAKVTAIQTPKLDVALDGGIYRASLAALGLPDGDIMVTPVGWTASWVIHKRFSLHGGTSWTVASANGTLSGEDIGAGIAAVSGADITQELESVLGTGGLYAGANLTLYQTRLSADYRLNRRDSIILTSKTWVWANGLVAAGVQTDAIDGVELEAGASARVRLPLTESVPTLTTLSWQFDWRHANLRVGIPVPIDNYFAYFQAFDLFLILGPGRKPTPPVVPAQTAPTDTGTATPTDTGTPTPDTDTGTPTPDTDTGTPPPPVTDTGTSPDPEPEPEPEPEPAPTTDTGAPTTDTGI